MKSVVLLSGGLDSLVSLAIAYAKTKVVLAITFDYGQKAAHAEIRAAGNIAKYYRIPHRVIRLPWLALVTDTALVRKGAQIPTLRMADLSSARKAMATAKQVWVPNRNGVFINIAASFAEQLGGGRSVQLVTGFNREEATTFPDNSVPYLRAATRSLFYSTQNHVRVVSYTGRWDKVGIVKKGITYGAPFQLFYSCYRGGKKMCGTCESCLRSIHAFQHTGNWQLVANRFVTQ